MTRYKMTEVYYFNYSLNRAKFFSKISHIHFLRNWNSLRGFAILGRRLSKSRVSLSFLSNSSSISRRLRVFRACTCDVHASGQVELENDGKQACRMLYRERRCEAKGRRERQKEEGGEEARGERPVGKVEGGGGGETGRMFQPRYIPRDREKGTPRRCEVTRATTRPPFPTRARNVRAEERLDSGDTACSVTSSPCAVYCGIR